MTTHNSSELFEASVTAFKNARGNGDALNTAVANFFAAAIASGLSPEDAENILGINEPSIMDLAELSEEDEEKVIDTFEHLVNTQS